MMLGLIWDYNIFQCVIGSNPIYVCGTRVRRKNENQLLNISIVNVMNQYNCYISSNSGLESFNVLSVSRYLDTIIKYFVVQFNVIA